jgi:para-aminobenzoate synthetase component I
VDRTWKTFRNGSRADWIIGAAEWGRDQFDTYCLLNGNGFSSDKYTSFDQIIALGVADECFGDESDSFARLREFSDRHTDWLFGFFSYDLKNQLEQLQSSRPDGVGMPLMHFFRPVILLIPDQDSVRIGCLPGHGSYSDPGHVWREILAHKHGVATVSGYQTDGVPGIRSRVPRKTYLQNVRTIREHIQQGDIYEMNYCVEFFAEDVRVDPIRVYERLNKLSPTPFSCHYALGQKFLMCASPERFLKKKGETIVSQPIKGTIARGSDPHSDALQADRLFHDQKERSENVMIVDLVRNDLSRTARKGSVKVEELYGIYPFRQVYQMISTITSALRPDCHPTDVIRLAFPMGSMTGAPKVRAMQLIEQYEDTRRGLYSGAVGYISPAKDFDFNVVIRSILYNAETGYLSFMAGSAITSGSLPEKEYKECLLKAEAMRKALA